MGTQLVILAAGVGRRFGGLKQLTPVGPGGEAIMDYTVFDALRSGFDEIVLVIRPEIDDLVRAHVEAGFGQKARVRFVHQETEGRAKPWGTGQAVLAAGPVLAGPFAVANADDYYGRPALAALGAFLDHPATTPPTWAMVGFAVADTLPAEGAVSRGLVQADDGYLTAIEEVHSLRRHGDGAVWDAPDGPRFVPADAPVSMNLWGFGSEALADLERRFAAFLAAGPAADAECYLPTEVGAAVSEGVARVAVLPVASPWCGMTSAVDLAQVRATLAEQVADGTYPPRLWT